MISTKITAQDFAELISRLTGTLTAIPLIILMLFWRNYELDLECKIVFFVIFLIIGWLIPISFFIYALRRGWVKDVDATDRKDRLLPYTISSLGWVMLFFISKKFLPPAFFNEFLYLFILNLVAFLITFIYKVSVHAVMNTTLYLLVNQSFNWALWWLFPWVIGVGWSRWLKKKHTFGQLFLGAALPLTLWYLFNRFDILK